MQLQKLSKKEFRKIPDEWEIIKINDLGEIVTGNTPSTSFREYYGNDYLWASPIDLGDTKYIESTQTMLSNEGFQQSRNIPQKSVLVVCIGSTIGKVGIAKKEMSTNQQINSIICKEDIDNEFIYYQLVNNQKKIKDLSNQLAIRILNKNDFGLLEIIKPKRIKEQQKISSILSKVDELIQNTEQTIEQTQRLKKGLMQRLLTKGIGHTKFKKAIFGFRFIQEKIPESWKVLSIKEISIDGFRNGIFKKREDFGKGVPLVNVSDLFIENDIDVNSLERVNVNDNELKQFGINEGDIFFCRSSLVLDGIGRSNIISNLIEPSVFECHVMMLRPNKEKINAKFLKYYTNSKIARRFLLSIAMTLTMTTIRQPDLEKLPIVVPPLSEQEKIICILLELDSKINHDQYELENLSKLKRGLMQKLLTGKIRVKV